MVSTIDSPTPKTSESSWSVGDLITRAARADDTHQYRLAGHYISRAREFLRDQRIRNYAEHLALELTEQIRRNFAAGLADRQSELSLVAALADEDFWSAAGILEGQPLDRGGDLSGGLRYVQNTGAPIVVHSNPFGRA